jgi:hypothetical protein
MHSTMHPTVHSPMHPMLSFIASVIGLIGGAVLVAVLYFLWEQNYISRVHQLQQPTQQFERVFDYEFQGQ